MTEKCFDEGTIQAFLDGELETDLLENVARHTAACEVCAFLLHEAEEESAFAFSALSDEFNSLVPTERIRTNLYDAIAQIERPRQSFWNRIFGARFTFSTPSIMAFASLLLVFGLFTTLYIHRQSQNLDSTVAVIQQPPRVSETSGESVPVVNPAAETTGEEKIGNSNDNRIVETTVQRPTYKQAVESQPTIQKTNYRIEKASIKDPRLIDNGQRTNNRPLLGEESYVKTIATLSDSVNSRKDNVLRPSERVAFEKDLAVVDDAIAKMQKEVRKNPRNEAAKQVLRSSYQNKIDLLNSVAEKTELMALR
jgi:hypothetical protein